MRICLTLLPYHSDVHVRRIYETDVSEGMHQGDYARILLMGFTV